MLELAGTSWLDQRYFESLLLRMAKAIDLEPGPYTKQPLSRITLAVPSLQGKQEGHNRRLRVKIVDQEERCILLRLQAREEKRFEKAEIFLGGPKVELFFGFEPEDLHHKYSMGILVSYWGQDPRVTKLKLSYEFAVTCLGVFGGNGFGSRPSVKSHGLNMYCNNLGKGAKATVASTAQAQDEIE
jgi:hypothetical protein